MKGSGSSRSLGKVILAAAIAAALPFAGCSFIFVQKPGEDPDARVVTCTTSPGAPVVDTVFTVTNLASVAYVGSHDNATNKPQAMSLGVMVAAMWMASAIYGYQNNNKCVELLRRQYGDPYGGPTYLRRPAPGSAPAETAPLPIGAAPAAGSPARFVAPPAQQQ